MEKSLFGFVILCERGVTNVLALVNVFLLVFVKIVHKLSVKILYKLFVKIFDHTWWAFVCEKQSKSMQSDPIWAEIKPEMAVLM